MPILATVAALLCAATGALEHENLPAFQSYGRLSPEQAVEVLRTGTDWPLVVEALKTTAANPATRAEAIKFLDAPPNTEAIKTRIVQGYMNRGISEDQSHDLARSYDLEPGIISFINFVVAQDDPALFPVVLHVDYNRLGIAGGFYIPNILAEAASPDSPYEQFLLDHFTEKRNMQPVYELANRGSKAADRRYREVLLSDDFWDLTKRTTRGGHIMDRFSERGILGYHLMLLRTYETDSVVSSLFGHTQMPDGDGLPKLETADPKLYPALLSFILDAEKMKLTDRSRSLLEASKARLLALMAKHNIPPVPAPPPHTGRALQALAPPDERVAATPVILPQGSIPDAPALAVTAPAATMTVYSAAAIVLALLGLLIYLGRRKT